MDAAELKLQNLQYEKNHLVRQIRHCRDFHFDESTVTGLVDEATFARTAPAELCVPEQPHQHQVNRMSHELQQRQALCAQRDALLAEKAALVEANSSKRAVLEGMGAQLSSLVRLSLPLQELLQQKMSLRWQEQRPLAVLPPPLTRTLTLTLALALARARARALSLSLSSDPEPGQVLPPPLRALFQRALAYRDTALPTLQGGVR